MKGWKQQLTKYNMLKPQKEICFNSILRTGEVLTEGLLLT